MVSTLSRLWEQCQPIASEAPVSCCTTWHRHPRRNDKCVQYTSNPYLSAEARQPKLGKLNKNENNMVDLPSLEWIVMAPPEEHRTFGENSGCCKLAVTKLYQSFVKIRNIIECSNLYISNNPRMELFPKPPP